LRLSGTFEGVLEDIFAFLQVSTQNAVACCTVFKLRFVRYPHREVNGLLIGSSESDDSVKIIGIPRYYQVSFLSWHES
jgi:hypothetical protein